MILNASDLKQTPSSINGSAASTSSTDAIQGEQQYDEALAENLVGSQGIGSRVLSYRSDPMMTSDHTLGSATACTSAGADPLKVMAESMNSRVNAASSNRKRYICSMPYRILDAVAFFDDFYFNVLDWSAHNVVGVALGSTCYLWNADTQAITTLGEFSQNVSCVRFSKSGNYAAVAAGDHQLRSQVKIYDIATHKVSHKVHNPYGRVCAMAFNGSTLSAGSRDGSISHYDVRLPCGRSLVWKSHAHTQEVCGLTWNEAGTQLASGGNDNLCCVWEPGQTAPRYTFSDSAAAVKALAWCPFQANLLAAGGGTADRHIRLYNTHTGELSKAVDTKSQVCSLQWSKSEKELLSAHGYSQFQLSLWRYPNMSRLKDITGHTARVLHTAISPDGSSVCSLAADDTLRFWKVWDGAERSGPSDMNLRSGLRSKMSLATAGAMLSPVGIR